MPPADPASPFVSLKITLSALAHLGYGFACLNGVDVKLQLSKMRLLNGIDKAASLGNRERSKAGPGAFLDLDGGTVQPVQPPPAGFTVGHQPR
jgi:hypothetical protein